MSFIDFVFHDVMKKLASMDAKLDLLISREAKMAASLDTVIADVTAQKGVVDSAVLLLNTIHAELVAALAAGDLGKVQQISDALSVNTKALADAVAANPA